jgi:hypothetical protein
METTDTMQETDNWKMKTLILGGVIGAVAGLMAAYVLISRAENEQTRPQLTAGDGVKVGIGLLGLLRLISDSSIRKDN